MKFVKCTLVGARHFGIYQFSDRPSHNEIGISLWKISVGVQHQRRKPRLSKKKYQNSVDNLSAVIALLDEMNTTKVQSEENMARLEQRLNHYLNQ